MRTEKNFKNLFEETNSSLEENKSPASQLRRLLSTYRLNLRQKFVLNPINYVSILTVLPFVVGFSQFLSSNSNLRKTDSFFEKNIPVLTNFKPKLDFETFEYISKSDGLTDLGTSENFFLFSKPSFIAKIKKPNFIPQNKFTGLSCNFYLLPSGNFVSKTDSNQPFFRRLDELPSYFQGLKRISEINQDPFTFFEENDRLQQELFLLTKSIKNKKLNQKTTTKNSIISKIDLSTQPGIQSKLPLISKLNAPFTNPQVTQTNLSGNLFSDNRLSFYSDIEQLNAEIEKLFIDKTISLNMPQIPTQVVATRSNNFGVLDNFLKQNSELDETFISEFILQNLDKKILDEELLSFRRMSGYSYPDMTSKDLEWFYRLNQYQNVVFRKQDSVKLKIKRNHLPSISTKYNFDIQKLPEILIETKKLMLTKTDENKLVYEGPALIVDSQRALDWKTRGNKSLRTWFNSYLSPLNSLIQFPDNFFGVYESPKFARDPIDSLNFGKKSLLRLKPFQHPLAGAPRWIFTSELIESHFAPFQSSLHLVNEKQTFLMKGITLSPGKTNERATKEQFLPIVQIQQPIFKNSQKSKTIFQGYSSFFDFGVKGNPDYIFSIEPLNEKNFITKIVSGRYKKIASIFSKNPSSDYINVDNWEPLTSSSWLVISQLSFALFIFHILKSLAANYGRELLGYLLDLVASLGILDDSLKKEIEFLMGDREKGFRVVLQSRKTFTDIVGIQKFLPEINEVVWFLRNSARDLALGNTLPRGILLTGPPGTGKTLLVQALAGEAQVPVVVLSGSSLIEPGESGADKLEMAFQEARQVAPCIVFIDEIDSLAQKREGVVQNPMDPEEVLECLTSFEKPIYESPVERLEKFGEIENETKEGSSSFQQNSQQAQLSLLTQLLIELDGIRGRDGVIVIGATNRPEVLDPAILRPGRFEKILQVGLPGPQKRIEILQFYGQALGYQETLAWNYLGDRTVGFTAADLATLMNESTIKAILNQTNHTIETIEHGIDRLTTSKSEKSTVFKKQGNTTFSEKPTKTLSVASKMWLLRLAYYQAGKIVLSYLLETHPKSVFASLWPRRPSIRSVQLATNLQNSLFERARLCELTDRVIGCYAGKAAEFLFLEKFSANGQTGWSQLSTLGLEDLLFAQKLIYSIVDEWSFYSKKSQIQKTIELSLNRNEYEFRQTPEKLDLYSQFIETIQIPPIEKEIEKETSSLKKKTVSPESNDQIYYSVPWWQKQVSDELELMERNVANWHRFYLSNPELNERNPEWVPPDEYYHSASGLKNVKKGFSNLEKQKIQPKSFKNKGEKSASGIVSFPWNDVTNITRDYPVHSLVLQSFNKALLVLNQNRELLDRLVIELLYHEILRQPEIENLMKDFKKSKLGYSPLKEENKVILKNKTDKPFHVLESSWGPKSRKALPRWINFAEF